MSVTLPSCLSVGQECVIIGANLPSVSQVITVCYQSDRGTFHDLILKYEPLSWYIRVCGSKGY